ncbi:hypothetical protein NQZ79_g7007 [Umbelopsis isabellina]|nr:hypothetical protein NQZ79_g7007 [Umbelopsis isabellina]
MSDKGTIATNVTVNEYMTGPDANPHIPLLDVPITRLSDLNLTNYMQYVCTHFDYCNIGEQEPGRMNVMPPTASIVSTDHQISRNFMLTKSASNLASAYATYFHNEELSYYIITETNFTTGMMLESMKNLMSSYNLLINNGPIVQLSASNQDPTLGLLTQGSAYAARYTNLFSVLNGTNALGVFETRSVDTMSLKGLSLEQAYTMLTTHVQDNSMASQNLTSCFAAKICRVLRLSSTSQGDYVKMILMGKQNNTVSASYAVRKARYFLMALDEDVGSPAQSNYNGSLVDDYASGWQHLVPILQLSVVNSSFVVNGPSTYTTHLNYDTSNFTYDHMRLVASHTNCSRNGNLTFPTNRVVYTAATDLKISILILYIVTIAIMVVLYIFRRTMTLPHYYENLFWTLPTCRMTDNADDLSHRFTVNWSLMIDEELKQVTPIYQVIRPGGPRPVRDSVIRSSLDTKTNLSDLRVASMRLDEARDMTGKSNDSAIFGGFKEYIEELCPSEISLQRLYQGSADHASTEELEYHDGAQ